MLTENLTRHFEAHLAVHREHDAVLWFDPDREYAPLLDHLTKLDLWKYDGSLLEIRYRLNRRGPDERTVVYLPVPKDDAEILRPFFATSLIFRDRLYKFLRKQGIEFPDDPEVAHLLRSLLPRLLPHSIGKGREFWERNLSNLWAAVETLLGGNFDDALLRFLARPSSELEKLQEERLDALFFAQLEETYGLTAAPGDDPGEVARRLTAQLALVRAFTDAGEPDDFPYEAHLPEPVHFERCESFLDRWQRDSLYKGAYVGLATRLEKRYDLARWVRDMPLVDALALGATFGNVELALRDKALIVMEDLDSEADWRTWLGEHRAQFEERVGSFWAQAGDAAWWNLLVRAADLLTGIHDVCQDLDRQATPGEMLGRYAQDWWRVDHDFRRLREAFDAQTASLGNLRDRCALSYHHVLRDMNDRFALLLETEGAWPPKGEPLSPQESAWTDMVEAQEPKQRVAVLFVDALRYELARELLSTLESASAGDRRSLKPRLAAVPTVTPMGMAALLPGGDRRLVDYDGEWRIKIEDSGNLKQKDARKAWLTQSLDDVRFYDLDELLNTPSERIPEATFIVVFDTTLDAVGETASTIAWNAFSGLLRSVQKGVHRLLETGIEQIHVVTDHGFLLLEKVAEHEKVSIGKVPALAKKSRYVVGRHLGHTDQLSFHVPGSPESNPLEAWFPRGVGCFRTPGPYNYVHGGLSLQELVVPHLTVEQKVLGKPVRVRADFPEVIRNAQPAVRLHPVGAGMFDQPRQVTVTLERDGEPVVPALSQVVRPAESTRVSFFLPMQCGLEPGDEVRWVLRDAVTEEVLAEQDAVNRADLW